MNILFATSECAPFIKSGGLADVLGSLPQSIQSLGHQCCVVLPKYHDLKGVEQLQYVTHYDIYVGSMKKYCGVFKCQKNNVTYYFIDNEEYFNRPGLYSYDDDYERFAFFDFAVLELISHLQLKIDLIHLHDWQTAMIAPLYKEKYQFHDFYRNIKLVFTIHNIAYQGKADPKLVSNLFGLPYSLYEQGQLRNDDCFNMMKSAIVYSDKITTVSPTYAKEILTDEYGEGLQYILRMRQDDLCGILNGIDYNINNPKTDPNIYRQFDIHSVDVLKVENKIALQKELGLPVNKNIPLIGIVTRLTWQKGIDLILNQMHELLQRNCQIVVLGAGDYQYEQALQAYSNYKDKFSLNLKYDFGLSCRIYASCDFFLMPSLFEPCGLSQMMSMRYGTLPIVRETGGLKDSVIPYNQYTQEGTGFSFANYNAKEMLNIIDYALSVYTNKDVMRRLIHQAMSEKLDWQLSAKMYEKLFKEIVC